MKREENKVKLLAWQRAFETGYGEWHYFHFYLPTIFQDAKGENKGEGEKEKESEIITSNYTSEVTGSPFVQGLNR